MNAHGKWQISWIGNLLVIDLIGSFNKEGVMAVQQAVRDSVDQRKISHWNRLEIYHANTLATPDAIEIIRDFMPWYDLQGCENYGVVCADPIQLMLIESLQPNNLLPFENVALAKDFFLKSERLIS